MIELLAFGELNPDIVVRGVPTLEFGQREVLVSSTTMTVGGSVAILSCGAARLGAAVGLVGLVGEDAFGSYLLDQLAAREVDISGVRIVPEARTGSSTILVRAADPTDRQILTDPGVMGELGTADVVLDQLPELRHLHIGSWFLQTGAVRDLPELLAAARARGIRTSVDPNDDPARTWDSHLRNGLAYVDVLFCNEAEARNLAGEADPVAAGRALLARMAAGEEATVVLKCGAAGAYAISRPAVVHVPAPAIDVVDTVGAGDSLAAGYLTALLRGASVIDALTFAVAVGSLSTRRAGGVDGQPTAEQASRLAATLTAHRVPIPPENEDLTLGH